MPIRFREMKAPLLHAGHYFLYCTTTPTYQRTAVISVVEDLNGDVQILSLYYFTKPYAGGPNELLPVGSILLIKAPSIRYYAGDAIAHIDVESPSDLIILHGSGKSFVAQTPWS
jgi:hypothetical protein